MKRMLIGVAIVAAAVALALASFPGRPAVAGPDIVAIPPGSFSFRPAGDFRRGNRVIDAPLETRVADEGLWIMRDLVSRRDYALCVADGACVPSTTGAGELPQTDVSLIDAMTYAAWLSAVTSHNWRLPTDSEWARAAAERFSDGQPADEDDGSDPSKRWLRDYLKEVKERGEADAVLRPPGGFGLNANGVADLAGNVWEWTSTCFQSAQIDDDGNLADQAPDYCGVRVVEGRHRAFIIDFVRDAKVGGCAVGVPPDFLGFRLVRDS
jgi:formylglycine-generating enzyme required for sulfatase activity